MVLPQPPESRGEQEAPDFSLPIVKDPGTPAIVLPLQGIAVFIEAGAVKLIQALLVLTEVGGHPVQKHRQARPVEPIHQVLEVPRGTVARGGGEIAGTLVAPGGIQRILRHRHQLHRRVAHVGHIVRQLVRQLPVVKGAAVAVAPPGAQVDFVNIQRAL